MNGHFANDKEKRTWDCKKILVEAGADQKIVDLDGKTANDWIDEYHNAGPTRKQFNRGGGKQKPHHEYKKEKRLWFIRKKYGWEMHKMKKFFYILKWQIAMDLLQELQEQEKQLL